MQKRRSNAPRNKGTPLHLHGWMKLGLQIYDVVTMITDFSIIRKIMSYLKLFFPAVT